MLGLGFMAKFFGLGLAARGLATCGLDLATHNTVV